MATSVAKSSHAPLDYRVTLERDDNDTVLVSFPDFPEAHTFGETEDEALVRAKDALATVIDAYIKARRPLRPPSDGPGPVVPVPALTVAKMGLHDAMVRAGVTKTELARRLDVHLPQVDRLLDVRHASRFDQVERALSVLGERVVLVFRPLVQPPVAVRPSRGAQRRRPARAPRRRGRGDLGR